MTCLAIVFTENLLGFEYCIGPVAFSPEIAKKTVGFVYVRFWPVYAIFRAVAENL